MDLLQRAEDYWFAPWRSVIRDATDAIKDTDSLSPTRIALAVAERVMTARGRFVKKHAVPSTFYAVAAFHGLCVAGLLAYPFVTRSREYDGWFVMVLALVYMHWLVCYGECILSWAEKKLYYTDYSIGDAPLHIWFMDALSLPKLVAIVCLFTVVSWAGLARVALRNVAFGRGEIGFSLKFRG